jgi:uncharacterized protein YkwD
MSRCGRFALAPRAATKHQLRSSTLCLINLMRERHGVAPLSYSEELRRSASAHSESMVRGRYFSHYGPGGSTPLSRIARTGYLASASSFRLAENIADGIGRRFGSPFAIVRDWMHSPEHRRNILDPALREFGAGVVHGAPIGGGDDAATYTLDFASRGGR